MKTPLNPDLRRIYIAIHWSGSPATTRAHRPGDAGSFFGGWIAPQRRCRITTYHPTAPQIGSYIGSWNQIRPIKLPANQILVRVSPKNREQYDIILM